MSKVTQIDHTSRKKRTKGYTPHPREFPDFGPKPGLPRCWRWMHCDSSSKKEKQSDEFCKKVLDEVASYLRAHHCDPHLRPASLLCPDDPPRTLYVHLEDEAGIHNSIKVFVSRLRKKYHIPNLIWEDIANDPFDEMFAIPIGQTDMSL